MASPNPIHLPSRFQIRQLTERDVPHALAITTHANTFHSPIWAPTYPNDQAARAYRLQQTAINFIAINVISGLSYGVFDTEYKFKRPESAATGGKLWWDSRNTDATGAELLEQMDFPLVSIAMAYDGAEPRDGSEWAPILESVPAYAYLRAELARGDKRDPDSWKPRGYGEVVRRGGTATRQDYAGFGLAKGMAHWHLWEMKGRGFSGYQITTAHPGLSRVFLNPPAPFRAELVSRAGIGEVEVEDGEEGVVRPFGKCEAFDCCLIWVDLR
ncbi:hypothetical protein B0T18DRAFT_325907 [Schizothecium vesticola]|uniref:Uncharacterized protein n=1 Tax=Schizothecium vesticola TaxID=314040 RepID=A0AA40EUA0_9PEZI|nr:hypothetical protein B0T18DRAFT_325907 [Schizothecium vesticola]